MSDEFLPVLLLMAKVHDSALKGEWIRLSFRHSWIPYHPRSDFVYRGMTFDESCPILAASSVRNWLGTFFIAGRSILGLVY
jgi:hypothetical protein